MGLFGEKYKVDYNGQKFSFKNVERKCSIYIFSLPDTTSVLYYLHHGPHCE